MEGVAIVLFVTFAVTIAIVQVKRQEQKIKDAVHFIGGEVVNIKKKAFCAGPFLVVRRGDTIYRIEYRKGTELKEGWVKFGNLLGPDWKL